ncbi:hypothetical protein [Micromonospora sp. WMMD812]|uniref:hypothetical protein n=1 Tax=Micromonospora sp. WMMD812 TaxID=3015152 RepID=UPI00248B2268|nr:hypothetical protein [Micromonospora sp. WMMD812]WBB67021.1 hypothetical protein O7603_28535 [Micromonospora sp. WMMD812]
MLPLVCVLAGVLLLALPSEGSVLRTVVAVGVIVLGGVVLVRALRPFTFGIGPDGLTVRRPGLRRQISWAEVDALVLDQSPPVDGRPFPPRLLLVPARGVTVGLPTTARLPVDRRPAVDLLDLGQVRERPEEVAAALTRFAGERFLDAVGKRRAAFAVEDFTVGLRGYRMDQVDRLVRRGQEALAWGGVPERQAARDKIEQARAAGLTVAQRGYAQLEVDEALGALSDALADNPSTDREPTT